MTPEAKSYRADLTGQMVRFKRAGQLRSARILRRGSFGWLARPISLADGKEYDADGDPAKLITIADEEIRDGDR